MALTSLIITVQQQCVEILLHRISRNLITGMERIVHCAGFYEIYICWTTCKYLCVVVYEKSDKNFSR